MLLSEDLCGFSSDLSKAFEHIPRPQTMALSRHLQVPETVPSTLEQFPGHLCAGLRCAGQFESGLAFQGWYARGRRLERVCDGSA